MPLLGEKMKWLATDHLGGHYLPSANRKAFAKIHKLAADLLTHCPELDEMVKDYSIGWMFLSQGLSVSSPVRSLPQPAVLLS